MERVNANRSGPYRGRPPASGSARFPPPKPYPAKKHNKAERTIGSPPFA